MIGGPTTTPTTVAIVNSVATATDGVTSTTLLRILPRGPVPTLGGGNLAAFELVGERLVEVDAALWLIEALR